MNCNKCNTSVFERPLKRINEKGVDGIWWCTPCLKKHNPELLKQLEKEESPVVKTLKEICYPKNQNL